MIERYNTAVYDQIEQAADLVCQALDVLGTLGTDLQSMMEGREPGPVSPCCADCIWTDCSAAPPASAGMSGGSCGYKVTREEVAPNVGTRVPLCTIEKWRD